MIGYLILLGAGFAGGWFLKDKIQDLYQKLKSKVTGK